MLASPYLKLLNVVLLLAAMNHSYAAPPANYYTSVDLSSATALKTSLHEIIDDHARFPYTSSQRDTWDIINQADEDPLNPDNVLTIYKNASYPKASGGNDNYNREHSWPKSFGFPDDGSDNYPYTDLHHLFVADSSYNSSRSNLPFGECDAECSEKVTNAYNGQGGTSGVYPGESNWRRGSGATGTWEVWEDRKGDIARAMFYMAVRYEGGSHGVTGAPEPDLELTDDLDLIGNSNTGSNMATGYMGRLSVLLRWHKADPVDALEQRRNDVVADAQGNRNPFIDHPEYVGYVFENGLDEGGNDQGATSPEEAYQRLVDSVHRFITGRGK
jgi:endonuclease I